MPMERLNAWLANQPAEEIKGRARHSVRAVVEPTESDAPYRTDDFVCEVRKARAVVG